MSKQTHPLAAVADGNERELRQLKRKNREYEKHLKEIVKSIEAFLSLLDRAMTGPSTVDRGKEIARLSNALEMSKDHIRFFALDIDPRTGKKRKPV